MIRRPFGTCCRWPLGLRGMKTIPIQTLMLPVLTTQRCRSTSSYVLRSGLPCQVRDSTTTPPKPTWQERFCDRRLETIYPPIFTKKCGNPLVWRPTRTGNSLSWAAVSLGAAVSMQRCVTTLDWVFLHWQMASSPTVPGYYPKAGWQNPRRLRRGSMAMATFGGWVAMAVTRRPEFLVRRSMLTLKKT